MSHQMFKTTKIEITEDDVVEFLQLKAEKLREKYPDGLVTIDVSVGLYSHGGPHIRWRTYCGNKVGFLPIDPPVNNTLGDALAFALAHDPTASAKAEAARLMAKACDLLAKAEELCPNSTATKI